MSWSMPPPGPWNPMAQSMQPGPMSGCTPEQWAVMQQQNWLQWSQWQQQYAQWQNEYGEKYAQQMQAMQAVGSIPPLPNNSAPPPPPPAPPPDQPPPPPPHENNQPLYAQNQIQPAPVPAPHIVTNMNNPSGSQNRTDPTIPSVNSEALKKLAEEERLFDIQFQKWEEEIQKWKKENVNHPDKQAYVEYEQKFEACRAQLLERREQMILKRARLLGNTGQIPKNSDSNISMVGNIPPVGDYPAAVNIPPVVNPIAGNIPIGVPPPQEQNLNQNLLFQNYTTKTSIPPPIQNTQHQQFNKSLSDKTPATHFPQSIHNQAFQQQGQQYSQPRNVPRFEQPNNKQQFEKKTFQQPQREVTNRQPNNYQNSRSDYSWNNDNMHKTPQSDYDNSNDGPQGPGYNISNNMNFNDKYESYQDIDDECSNSSNFLPTGDSHKGIPGLDLVPDDKAPTIPQDVIDITEEPENEKPSINQPLSQGPDYSKISMGINSILGDEKIMNILSMVRNIPVQNTNTPNAGPSHSNGLLGSSNNNNNGQQGMQWSDNRNNQQFDNRQSLLHSSRLAPKDVNYQNTDQNLHWEENSNRERNLSREQNSQIQQNPQWEKNPHWEINTKRDQNPQWEQNSRQDNNSQWELNNDYSNKRIFEARHHNKPNDNYLDRNQQNIGQNIQPRPLLSIVNPNMPNPNMTHSRAPLQDMSIHQNVYSNQPLENKGINEGNIPSLLQQPSRPKWVEVPMFNPSIIVEYEHKSLRLKARDFIEPVHTFDYNHKSKEEEKRVNFEREADDLFTRKAKKFESENRVPFEWSTREQQYRDFERKPPREDFRDESRGRLLPRDHESRPRDYDRQRDFDSRPRDYESRPKDYEGRSRDYDRRPRDYESRPRDYDRQRDYESRSREYDDRKRTDEKYDDRKREDRDKFVRREDLYKSREWDKEKEESEREFVRDKISRTEYKRDEVINPERDFRKRALSKETETESAIKKIKGNESPKGKFEAAKHIVMIDDILESPGRDIRPQKIVIILRGPPGSGKSYLAKLIRDREAQNGGTVRIMSIDDYFMQEGEMEEKDPTTGKMVKKPSLKYEYEEKLEDTYLSSLKRAFKRTITDGYFTFLIYDAVNDQLKGYADIWNFARQNGFQVYICTLELDPQICFKRNIHERTLDDIQVICSRFFPTPAHHIQLDPTTLLQNAAIPDVHMEDASDDVIMEDAQEPEVENVFTSKWEKMDEAAQLARLDGTSKPLRSSHLSMEDYLQLDDWKPSTAKPGKKTVRWADIEERRQQEKMRAIGFVVGQTDWSRMTDPTLGSSALTQTKYIERVKRF